MTTNLEDSLNCLMIIMGSFAIATVTLLVLGIWKLIELAVSLVRWTRDRMARSVEGTNQK